MVLYKGILGTVEVLFGSAMLAVTLGANYLVASGLAQAIINEELSEDPHDLFMHWLLTHNFPLSHSTALGLGALALGLGLAKLFIAAGIWFRSGRMRSVSLLILGFIGAIGLGALIRSFSWFKLLTVGLDLAVLYYLWRVLPHYLKTSPLDRIP